MTSMENHLTATFCLSFKDNAFVHPRLIMIFRFQVTFYKNTVQQRYLQLLILLI